MSQIEDAQIFLKQNQIEYKPKIDIMEGLKDSSNGLIKFILANNKMPSNVRLGLIGAGKWGVNYIKTIESMKGIELRKIACKTSISKKGLIF